MARTFVAANPDKIQLSLGAVASGGATTFMAMVRPTTIGASQHCFTIQNSGPSGIIGLGYSATGKVRYGTSGTDSDGLTSIAASSWYVIATSRPAGAAQTVRIHIFDVAAGTWTHENSATTQGNAAGTPVSNALGVFDYATQSAPLNADLAWVAVWTSALTDVQVEQAAFSWTNLLSLAPQAAWLLDQATTGQKVVDWSGGGANESAIVSTSVSTASVPLFTYGHPVRRVQRTFAAAGVTVSPSAGVLALGAAAPTLTVTVSPSAGVLALGAAGPTVAAATLPAAGVLALAAAAPTLTLTVSVTVSPSAGVIALSGIGPTITGPATICWDPATTATLTTTAAGTDTLALAAASTDTLTAAAAATDALTASSASADALTATPVTPTTC